MRFEQQPLYIISYFERFYRFIKNRDAKIVELFFLGLHLWALVATAMPIGTFKGPIITLAYTFVSQLILVVIIMCISCLNLTALIYAKAIVRIISACVNVAAMLIASTILIRVQDASAGTYFLLAVLAAFVCWKVNVKK